MYCFKQLGIVAAFLLLTSLRALSADNPSVSVPAKPPTPTVAQICAAIATNADGHGVPRDFFARLIWKESRFDAQATSPVGAQGIAQFMPGTAKERNLDDPFDFAKALPASAALLKDLRTAFGNWGLAAAAYNAGPTRVSKWLSSGGFLPLETEEYVLDITGKSADDFAAGTEISPHPLNAKLTFDAACRKLPDCSLCDRCDGPDQAQAVGYPDCRQLPPRSSRGTASTPTPRLSGHPQHSMSL